jgi:hypothetical protein
MNDFDDDNLPEDDRPWQFSLAALIWLVTGAAALLSIATTPYLAAFFCLYSFVWFPFLIVWAIRTVQRKAKRRRRQKRDVNSSFDPDD